MSRQIFVYDTTLRDGTQREGISLSCDDKLRIAQKLDDLPPASARAVFLTTQESLANVARHARAENVTLTLVRSDSVVTLVINDDGQGFDPHDESRRVGHGLANMQERADGLGGLFKIRSAPGQGTTATLRLPL